MRFDKAIIIIVVVVVAAFGAALAWSTIPTNSQLLWRVQGRERAFNYDYESNHPAPGTLLRSQPFDDTNDAISDEENDGTAVEQQQQQRRRKRDILRRTLGGLSTFSSSSTAGDDVKKLNTDKFLSSRQPSYNNNNNNNNNNDDSDDAPIVFRSPGQIQNPDLLTPEEISNVNSKYDALKRITEERTLLELLHEKSDDQDKEKIASTATTTTTIISTEEARRIVDYTVDEERLAELRALDEIKKKELIQQWEEKNSSAEDKIDAEMMMIMSTTTTTGIKTDAVQRALQNDGVVREILQEEERQMEYQDDALQQRNELEMYERTMMAQVGVGGDDGAVNYYDNGEEGGGQDGVVVSSFDDAYETAIGKIQKSRRNKIGPRTLGILANSFALEEGKEYIRKSKREKEFLMEVERELELYFRQTRGAARKEGGDVVVVVGDEDVTTFFRPPENLAEERMYRSIIRQIADKRESENEDGWEQKQQLQIDDFGVDDDEDGGNDFASSNANEVDNDDDNNMISKYKLSAKETVEAYKLLNLWREVQSLQDSMEVSLGMKDDDAARRLTKPTNKIEPFFLYEEDTEEKRRKEKESLNMALRKVLESEDNAEISSNELLMKELLEGRVTKDKLVRLLDKLSTKATDVAIKNSLVELKNLILEGKEKVEGTTIDDDGVFFSKRKKNKLSGQPLDLSGVFRTSDMGEEEELKAPVLSSLSPTKPLTGGRTMPSWVSEEASLPNTFSSSSSTDDTFDEAKAPLPPNTPFFQALNDEGEDDSSRERSPAGGMFGTYEEQRLQKLAKRVGAQTDEEMEELRRNMEALKEAEMLADARLNDDTFDLGGIDISSLNLDDDNDDQIKSILGKRPVAPSSISSSLGSKKVVVELNEKEETEGIFVDAEGRLRKMDSGGKERDIAADIFRAKTAGRYTDEETREADEAAFRDFLKLEEEVERSLELLDNEAPSVDIDIDAYADDIMSEMAPRPQLRPRREDFMSQEELQLERKKESIFGDDDSYPVESSRQGTSSSSGGSMPEWFLKEQEAMGIKVEDIDEDDFDEARREWEREERQRKADEYMKKRGGGISISDVLGREYFGPMDEPDYGRSLPAFDSFQARKELLLGYTELTVEDINNVVDYKVDPLSNGYNRYLARVQQPFSEYGAVFRLEGVLVDMIGMHAKAWKKVTEAFGYRLQSSDDVKQASLYKPEDAVREVFYWTDDVVEIRDIAKAYRAAFNEAFNEWTASGCVLADTSGGQSFDEQEFARSVDSEPKIMPSGEEMHSMYFIAWSKLALSIGRTAPTFDEVYRGMLGGNWDDAVRDIFLWSNDPSEVHDILAAYDAILEEDYKILLQKYGIDVDLIKAKEEQTLFGLDSPALSLQEGVRDCLDTLREVEMPCAIVTHLDSTQLEMVLERTGLAEYFAPDKRVSSDSNYSSERSELLGAALRVEQRPDQCIVFDNTPKSATVAHEICMKSVSVVDHYARYELLTADLAVGSASDVDLRSLVKLFDKRDDLEPLLELDVNSGLQKQQRKLRTAFWDE